MDGLHVLLAVLIGVVSCSHNWVFTSTLDLTVKQGDNITLYCDCRQSSGVYIMWYRNCSHENQPTLVLRAYGWQSRDFEKKHFEFVKNFSSESYDLQIINVTDSDEGLYYCGTEQTKVEEKEKIGGRSVYAYGNVTTRVKLNSSDSSPQHDCSGSSKVSWMLAFTPALTVLSSFVSFVFVYHFCQKTEKGIDVHQNTPDNRGQTRWYQDEDMCLTWVVFRVKDGPVGL